MDESVDAAPRDRGGWRLIEGGEVYAAHPASRSTVINFRISDPRARRYRGEVPQFGAVADDDVSLQHAGRTDIRVFANLDRADDEFVAFAARIPQPHLRADACAGANGDEIDSTDLDITDQRIIADFRTERAQEVAHQR